MPWSLLLLTHLRLMDIIMVRLAIFLIYYVLISTGPMPNPNPDWVPLSLQAAQTAGTNGTCSAHAQHMLS